MYTFLMKLFTIANSSNILLKDFNGYFCFWILYFNPFTPKSDLIDFTLSDARQFYSSKGDPLGVKGIIS